MASDLRRPTSDDATTGTWSVTPTSPTTKFDKVDEAVTDDADFITCTALSGGRGRQTFGFSAFALESDATVQSVVVDFRGRKAASQAANVGGALKVLGLYYDAGGRNPAQSFTAYADTWATNPTTGLAWTPADINGTGAYPLQGFGVTTGDTTPNVSASQVSITVNFTLANRRGRLSWVEFETPDASTNRRGQISWVELETPDPPRRGLISWIELETPDAPRRGLVSWLEFEAPDAAGAGRRALVSWIEFATAQETGNWLKAQGHSAAVIDALNLSTPALRTRAVLDLHEVTDDEYHGAGGALV